MPSNMQSQDYTREANAGDHNRIDGAITRRVIDIAQGWLKRQSLKIVTICSTAVSAYVFGKWGVSQENALAIGAGVAAGVAGIIEIVLSYINMKFAPKAEKVD